ncbi:ATP-dependent RNA helicase protein [Plasmodium gonderi]|uniref:ATP-dependent RNA helicase n=1 Tax=Plasmodium gonderi TaxID=77519 RepID=A0A1Y1JAD6_PLAGO|nr:ATP-dependent RNA helicase protein [Plasmodium gonderi]GAW79230.1 ATP-dependent RNA helicase protein [Plasmodium gonderi]
MKNSLYINQVKKFVENISTDFFNFDDLIEEGKTENDVTTGSRQSLVAHQKKVHEVHTSLNSNCRIIKIEDEEIEIAKWNEMKSVPLNEFIIKALINNFHFQKFLPCQSYVLEYALLSKNESNSLLNGDIYIEVPTGLGKTLCYIITILDYFLYNKDQNGKLFCLILTATEELVTQILRVINNFHVKNLLCQGINTNMFQMNIYFDELIDNNDVFNDTNIIVTTTNKFESLFFSNEKLFQNLKFLVIDEVDKIMSFNKSNINNLVNSLSNIVEKYETLNSDLYKPKKFLQKFFVSATLCKVSDNLMSLNLYRPIFFYYIVKHKRNEEFYLITKKKYSKVYNVIRLIMDIPEKDGLSMLIFCKSEESVHLLYRFLTVYFSYIKETSYKIKEYTRNLSNSSRKKILNQFLSQKLHILICTDSISRGLDTVNVNYVVNYDMPNHYNVLTHRIGRLSRYNSRRGTVYHLIKEKDKIVMIKSIKQRRIKGVEKIKFKKEKLMEIKRSITCIKSLINDVIIKEDAEILSRHQFYCYDDLVKLCGVE